MIAVLRLLEELPFSERKKAQLHAFFPKAHEPRGDCARSLVLEEGGVDR